MKLSRKNNINTAQYWNKRYFKIKDNIPAIPSVERFFEFGHLPKDEDISVLDIGCGTATHYPYVRDHYPKVKFIGADISNFAIIYNKKNFPFFDYFQIDIDNEELPGIYDYIISAHTFEHLTDPISATQKCIKAAKKNVIICVPYKDSWAYEQEHMHTFSEVEPYNPQQLLSYNIDGDIEQKAAAIYFVFKGAA